MIKYLSIEGGSYPLWGNCEPKKLICSFSDHNHPIELDVSYYPTSFNNLANKGILQIPPTHKSQNVIIEISGYRSRSGLTGIDFFSSTKETAICSKEFLFCQGGEWGIYDANIHSRNRIPTDDAVDLLLKHYSGVYRVFGQGIEYYFVMTGWHDKIDFQKELQPFEYERIEREMCFKGLREILSQTPSNWKQGNLQIWKAKGDFGLPFKSWGIKREVYNHKFESPSSYNFYFGSVDGLGYVESSQEIRIKSHDHDDLILPSGRYIFSHPKPWVKD